MCNFRIARSSLRRTSLSVALALSCAVLIAACDSPAPPPAAMPAPVAAPAPPPPPSEPLEPELTEGVPEAAINTSSMLQPDLHGEGLLHAKGPGWHSKTPPSYPEWVRIHFKEERHFSSVSLLAQHMNSDRGPKQFDVQTSTDGNKWTTVLSVENGCDGEKGRWHSYSLPAAVSASWVRLQVRANCGEPKWLTLRGLRFE